MFPRNVIPSVKIGLLDAFSLFAGKHVQNNCSETGNSILDRTVCLQGCNSITKLARRIRTFFIIKNHGTVTRVQKFGQRHRSGVYFNKIFSMNSRQFQSQMNIMVY